jgi:hypothetical protein
MEGKGLVTGIVAGITFLVIAVIIGFTIIQNLYDISEDVETSWATETVINESGAWINTTAYTLNKARTVTGFTSPVIFAMTNTTSNLAIPVGNASVTTAGVVTNATVIWWPAVKISYTYKYKMGSVSTENLRGDFSSGINEVSEKIPTILLVVAVVIVLGILVILWQMFKGMGIGAEGQL